MTYTPAPASRSREDQLFPFEKVARLMYMIGTDGTIFLFLLQRNAKAIRTGTAVDLEGEGTIGDRIPVPVNEDRGAVELSKRLAHNSDHGGCPLELNVLYEDGRDGLYSSSHIRQEFAVVR